MSWSAGVGRCIANLFLVHPLTQQISCLSARHVPGVVLGTEDTASVPLERAV